MGLDMGGEYIPPCNEYKCVRGEFIGMKSNWWLNLLIMPHSYTCTNWLSMVFKEMVQGGEWIDWDIWVLFLINFGFFGIAEVLLISDYFGFISDAFRIFRLDVKKKSSKHLLKEV